MGAIDWGATGSMDASHKAILIARELKRRAEAERLSADLYEFFKAAWGVLEPSTKLVENWHLRTVCGYLQALEDGNLRSRRLIINIPPGASKSLITSVVYPAWIWTRDPARRILSTSNEDGLVTRDCVAMRTLVTSEWYQELWGDKVRLAGDQSEKRYFQTDKRGFRQGVPIRGSVTGKRGDCLVAETLVTTEFGDMPISELHRQFKSGKPIKVATYNHERNGIEWRLVLATKETFANELLEIATASGRSIRATGQHLIYTEESGYIPARRLEPGMRLTGISGWDVQPVRDGVQWDAMHGVLQQSSQAHCHAQVRPLREGVRTAAIRLREIAQAWRDESVLLSGVLPRVQKSIAASKDHLSGVWRKEGRHINYVREVQRADQIKGHAQTERRDMQGVRGVVSPQFTPDAVLRKGVRRRGSLQANDWARKLVLQGWEKLRGLLQGYAYADYGARFAPVCGLLQAAGACHSGKAWRGSGAVKFDRAPHQQGRVGQQTGESDNALLGMSHGLPSLEDDHVRVVRRVRGEQVPVYDIQVEGTSCFFANEVLVHNCLIIDDPHDAKKAFSDVEIASTIQAYDQGLSTRLNDLTTSPIVCIMQRLRTNDLTGHLLSKKASDWCQICIPMEYSGAPGFDPVRDIGLEAAHLADPRRERGELLDPVRFPAGAVASLKEDLGEYGTAGQLNQTPAPLSGGILKANWWRVWPDDKPLPNVLHTFASWDTAYSERDLEQSAYSACTVWGVWLDEKDYSPANPQGRHKLILLSVWWGRVDFPDLIARAQEIQRTKLDHPHDAHLIERKASGISLIQTLNRKSSLRVLGYDPKRDGGGDKVARAYRVQPLFQAGIIHIPNKPWAHEAVKLISEFPAGGPPCADLTDTVTQAVSYLDLGWWIHHPDDDADPMPIRARDDDDDDFSSVRHGRIYG